MGEIHMGSEAWSGIRGYLIVSQVAMGQVTKVRAHLKEQYRHLGIYRRDLKNIRHSLRTECQLQVGEQLDRILH